MSTSSLRGVELEPRVAAHAGWAAEPLSHAAHAAADAMAEQAVVAAETAAAVVGVDTGRGHGSMAVAHASAEEIAHAAAIQPHLSADGTVFVRGGGLAGTGPAGALEGDRAAGADLFRDEPDQSPGGPLEVEHAPATPSDLDGQILTFRPAFDEATEPLLASVAPMAPTPNVLDGPGEGFVMLREESREDGWTLAARGTAMTAALLAASHALEREARRRVAVGVISPSLAAP